MSAQITVRSGPNTATIDGAKTVGEIREAFASAFNIPESAEARVNGLSASEGETVSAGTVTFRVPTGEKG